MTKSSWPVQYSRTCDRLDIATMANPGVSPPFLVVTPVGSAGRVSSSQIPGVAEFCGHFLRGHACFEFEWRGTGLSDRPSSLPQAEDYANDIAAVARDIGEPFHVLAFGTACVPTIQYLADDADSALSLVLDGPSLRPPEWFRSGLSAEEYHSLAAMVLRSSYDFPPDVVAREVLPAFLHDAPLEALTHWLDVVCIEAASLPAVSVPTLIHTDEASREEATAISQRLPQARLIIGRSYPWNGTRGDVLRDAFDVFWSEQGPEARANGRAPGKTLSEREMEVLRLMVDGRANKEIAATLSISQPTVATHVRHILEKTGSANRAQATAWAIRNGLG